MYEWNLENWIADDEQWHWQEERGDDGFDDYDEDLWRDDPYDDYDD